MVHLSLISSSIPNGEIHKPYKNLVVKLFFKNILNIILENKDTSYIVIMDI